MYRLNFGTQNHLTELKNPKNPGIQPSHVQNVGQGVGQSQTFNKYYHFHTFTNSIYGFVITDGNGGVGFLSN